MDCRKYGVDFVIVKKKIWLDYKDSVVSVDDLVFWG